MKRFLIIILFYGVSQNCVWCQANNKTDTNFHYITRNLPEFLVNDCLTSLLTLIEKTDSNHLRFPPDKFYYDLTFENRGDHRHILISPSRWLKSATTDFAGVITIGQMLFLCRGDFKNDSLFQECKNMFKISLRKPKLYQYDDIDALIESFTWKPSLAVTYKVCPGLPIDLFVLVGNKINVSLLNY
jgi:hypothetical protein